MNSAWLGILIAGMFAGSFAIPAKKIKRLRWDQTWLVYCVVAWVVLPVGLARLFAPGLFGLVLAENLGAVLVVAGCGASFGLGAFLFGGSIPRLGFALAVALNTGSVILVGSLSPLLIGAAKIGPGEGGRLALGLVLLLAGIALCARASILRDRGAGAGGAPAPTLAASLAGIALAVLSGVFAGLLNTSFAYGGGVMAKAGEAGIPPAAVSLAVWVPVLLGGFLVNLVATAWKISRVQGWGDYAAATAVDWVRAVSMSLLWFGGLLGYGISTAALGAAGTVYGWAVYAGVGLLTSTAWGFATGEWEQAGRPARLWMLLGGAVFVFSFAVLAVKGQPV